MISKLIFTDTNILTFVQKFYKKNLGLYTCKQLKLLQKNETKNPPKNKQTAIYVYRNTINIRLSHMKRHIKKNIYLFLIILISIYCYS